MENPWKVIDFEHTVPEIDKELIAKCNQKKLELNVLPEPFIGNPNSNVVLLNGNPGKSDEKTLGDKEFCKILKANLDLKGDGFMWLTDSYITDKINNFSGSIWWKNHTKELRQELEGKPLNLFVIEYFPYHSPKSFNYPKNLNSNAFRNRLLLNAIEKGKLIIIMRSEKKWYGIEENDLGIKLLNYKNKIVLKNYRNVTISKNNVGEKWNLLLEELRKPLKIEI